MSANTIDCFCINKEEKIVFTGDKSGRVNIYAIDSFKLINSLQVHYGSITTIAIHPKFNYLATLGNDGHIAILQFDEESLTLLHIIQTRNIKPKDDPYLRNHTTTQALSFHNEELRLVGHGGSSALFELSFNDKCYNLLNCIRIHENDDFFTAIYIQNTNKILSGSVSGTVTLSENNEIIKKWDFHSTGMPSIHWFEPYKENQYFIACDGMKVIKLDIINEKNIIDGPRIVNDHLEHVTYNKTSNRLFCASFDKTVTEVSINDCSAIRVVWIAPFKLRWIKTLESNPSIMIVQCRNGAIYKINIDSGHILNIIKNTLPALWSIDSLGNSLIASGEGNTYVKLSLKDYDNYNRVMRFNINETILPSHEDYYTKRLCVNSDKTKIAFGRTNGEVVIEENDSFRVFNLSSVIRDIVFSKNNNLFVVCENGVLYEIDIITEEIKILNKTQSPCWALAYNEKLNILVYGERHNNVHLLNLDNGKDEIIINNLGFIKRIKWQDDKSFLVGTPGALVKYSLQDNKTCIFSIFENTVEDFDWDTNKRYIVVVNYTRFLYLCDFSTGEILYEHGDSIDYSKGLLFLDKLENYNGYPGDFLVLGRSGRPYYHRVHDDRIISYGKV